MVLRYEWRSFACVINKFVNCTQQVFARIHTPNKPMIVIMVN